MTKGHWWSRPMVVIPAAVVASIALVVAMAAFQPWRLFIDVTVDEDLPTVASVQQSEPDASDDETGQGENTAESEPTAASEVSPSPAAGANEDPRPKRTIIAEGAFISHEHPTAGTARIITLEDGSRVLRLVGLDTDNGPDLKVWLAAAPVIEGRDGWFVFDDDDYLSLGALKGNKGNQNYPIPADADISDLTSVTIWCERFSVSFGAAELMTV